MHEGGWGLLDPASPLGKQCRECSTRPARNARPRQGAALQQTNRKERGAVPSYPHQARVLRGWERSIRFGQSRVATGPAYGHVPSNVWRLAQRAFHPKAVSPADQYAIRHDQVSRSQLGSLDTSPGRVDSRPPPPRCLDAHCWKFERSQWRADLAGSAASLDRFRRSHTAQVCTPLPRMAAILRTEAF